MSPQHINGAVVNAKSFREGDWTWIYLNWLVSVLQYRTISSLKRWKRMRKKIMQGQERTANKERMVMLQVN
ncbi:hypothetical protein Q7C36_001728 [Tachysurus vachellii]|uniref:Uncharacterized protein n=1 Tax=Tachysurus vachellii TaxID=175792 RepID=A0AA88NRL9_TACVA|nr:hypothetical protein Q7C36_001728 [Tachysurus vachellii]